MPRFFLALALAAPLLLAACQAPASESPTATATPSASPMMQPSPGVADATRQILAAFQTNDAAAIRAAFAETDALVVIGTDPTEYLRGHAETVRVLAEQAAALDGVTIEPGEIDAYERGDAGWSTSQPTFRFADGTELPARLTVVYTREGGVWRAVQWHLSVGMGNAETPGFESLPTE